MVSIIIPTFNRCNQLDNTLHHLMQLKTNANLFEIIVIDNGSTDDTKLIVEKYQTKYLEINLEYYYDSEPGLLTGRHLGASKAKGKILSFIDDDVHVSSTWLDTIIEVTNKNNEVVFFTGPNLPKYETYPPSWLNYFWKTEKNGKSCSWLSLLDLGNEIQEISPNYVWGLNFTIRKSAFIELGGFHPDCIPTKFQMFQGDGETGLTLKGIERGMKALYHPGVLLYHEIPSSRLTFEYFEKRAFYDGVCNSFSEIRIKNNLYKKKESTQTNYNNPRTNFFKRIKVKIKGAIGIINSKKNSDIPEEIKAFKEKILIKYHEGFDFHQEQYLKNENIKQWVLKENYFNYKLPND